MVSSLERLGDLPRGDAGADLCADLGVSGGESWLGGLGLCWCRGCSEVEEFVFLAPVHLVGLTKDALWWALSWPQPGDVEVQDGVRGRGGGRRGCCGVLLGAVLGIQLQRGAREFGLSASAKCSLEAMCGEARSREQNVTPACDLHGGLVCQGG